MVALGLAYVGALIALAIADTACDEQGVDPGGDYCSLGSFIFGLITFGIGALLLFAVALVLAFSSIRIRDRVLIGFGFWVLIYAGFSAWVLYANAQVD